MKLDLPAEVVERLRNARSVTVLTGGSLAQECGAPDFRRAQTGAWGDYDPQQLATVNAFLLTPRPVWEWFAHRRSLIDRLEPGQAHYALVDLEQRTPDFLLVTQAIDGLHWRAGTRDLVELHGNLARFKCFEEGMLVESWEDTGEMPPRCPKCGSYLRPDVVFFGEGLPEERIRRARVAADCELFLCIGIESMVEPAASLPLIAKRHGAFVLEVGRTPTFYTEFADHALRGNANEIVPELAPLIGSAHTPPEPEHLPIF
jgi:NAD-dependent deacetylase